MPKYNDFMPLPNRASVLIEAFSLAARRPQKYQSNYVRPTRRPRAAWAGTLFGFLAGVAVTGIWFIA